MKKLLKVLISLIIVYILLRLGIKHFGSGHVLNYKIDNFNIKETLSINKKNEFDNYYINIKNNEIDIDVQILNSFNKNKKILKKVKYEKIDDMVCILPIFEDGKILTDILCSNKKIINNYTNLKGKNNDLDNFAYRMKDYGYDFKKYENNLKKSIDSKMVKVFTGNILDDHFIAFNTYKGINIINPKDEELVKINLFDKDIYDIKLAKGLKNKYIIFDYNQKHEFSKIYIFDILTGKKEEIKLKNKISNNSKIIGTFNDSIYLIDYKNKKEYELNVKKESIIEVGNSEIGYITNDCKKIVDIEGKKILNKKYIMPNCSVYEKDKDYERVDLVGGMNSGYYYYFKKNDNNYKIYRSNVQKPNIKLYITETDNIDNIQYDKEYIYYLKNNQLNYYSDKTGIRTLMENTEFEFNKNLNYNLYIKES